MIRNFSLYGIWCFQEAGRRGELIGSSSSYFGPSEPKLTTSILHLNLSSMESPPRNTWGTPPISHVFLTTIKWTMCLPLLSLMLLYKYFTSIICIHSLLNTLGFANKPLDLASDGQSCIDIIFVRCFVVSNCYCAYCSQLGKDNALERDNNREFWKACRIILWAQVKI